MDPDISGSEIYHALRLSLHASSEPVEVKDVAFPATWQEGPSRGSPGFRKLIDGVLYSRSFILSYDLVLLALLLVFTVLHWGTRIRRWKCKERTAKRQLNRDREAQGVTPPRIQGVPDALEENRSGASSSSATLKGTPDSPKALSVDARENEQTPLLRKPKAARSPSWISWVVNQTRAILVYEPRPIPYTNKILPSNATTLVVLVFIALQVFYSLWNVPISLPMLFIFADRTSLVFVVNLPLLYLFAAKNQPLKTLTGYSYESLNIFHRRLGEAMCILALLHSVGMIGVWYTILRPAGFALARFLLSKIILLGLGAFVAYETLYFTSLGSFRQRWYELFLGIHVTLQAIALVLLWFHHHTSRPHVAAALAIFLIDRLVYRMSLKVETGVASLEVARDQETVVLHTSIAISEAHRTFRRFAGQSITNGWKATNHIFLTVPAISRKHIVQAHPFTIASTPPFPGDPECCLKLIIRAQDGFSRDLLKYANSHDKVTIRIDGPYGSQTAVRLLKDSETSIIIAGGSGIAVTWPLVWSVIRDCRRQDVEGLPYLKRVLFVWVVRHRSHFSWLETLSLARLSVEGVDIIVPPPTEEHGHPSIDGIVTDWLKKEQYPMGQEGSKIGVVCSGPDGMNRAVVNMCSSWLRDGRDVSVEIEKFGW